MGMMVYVPIGGKAGFKPSTVEGSVGFGFDG